MISVYEPVFSEEDARAVADAVRSGIVSSFGPCVSELENKIADHVGRRHALACSSGTTALHLALLALDIKDSRVAIPSCSYAATGFAASYCQNRIEFVDAYTHTWNMDMEHLEKLCIARRESDPIKAVIIVHNYGNPADMNKLSELSIKYDFRVIEDACEAMNARFDGRMAGLHGDMSVFSFYGNKLFSSGEGGMLLTTKKELYERAKLFRGQGQDPNRRFWHIVKGYNYRMTNIQAALVLSQFKRKDSIQARKMEIYEKYRALMPEHLKFQEMHKNGSHSWWMVSIRNPDDNNFYTKASEILAAENIESRPIFPPLHTMPAFQPEGQEACCPNAENLHKTSITIPSGLGITNEEIVKVCSVLERIK